MRVLEGCLPARGFPSLWAVGNPLWSWLQGGPSGHLEGHEVQVLQVGREGSMLVVGSGSVQQLVLETPAPMRRGGPWRNKSPAREHLFRTGTSQPSVDGSGPLCPQGSITLFCLAPGRKEVRRTSAGEPAQNRPLEKEIWTLSKAREWMCPPFP